jgi:hypothetical protein
MAIAFYVPSLSEDGWLNDPAKMGDALISHFYVSDYSQTQLYLGKVASLPYIVQQNANNIQVMCTAIQNTLTTYLLRYFPVVTVEAQEHPDPTDSSNAAIDLYISYEDTKGNTYNFANLIKTLNGTIVDIINIINTGDPSGQTT